MGRVTKVASYGDTLDARGELPEEQSVVIGIDGRGGSYRVWPEDRATRVDVMPSTHPLDALVKDIEYSRCGGDMRLALLRGHFVGRGKSQGRPRRNAAIAPPAWKFDTDASRLLYVFPTDVRVVVAACPTAFPSLKRVKELTSDAAPAASPPSEPEVEAATGLGRTILAHSLPTGACAGV